MKRFFPATTWGRITLLIAVISLSLFLFATR